MNKLVDFLGGVKVLEEIHSPVNGIIQVVRSFAFGTYIQVGGLTQTGGVVNDVWQKALKKLSHEGLVVKSCLILGLGGGGNAGIVRKMWPESIITAVEIDPIMPKIGRKYFKLSETKVKVVISDAKVFLQNNTKKQKRKNLSKYDLILVDLYIGDSYPEKFEDGDFIRLLKNNLDVNGIAVINRLFYGTKRTWAVKFLGKLEKIFDKVDVVYPEANVMYIARKMNSKV